MMRLAFFWVLFAIPRAFAFESPDPTPRSFRLGAGSVARTDSSLPLSQNVGASLWGSYDFRLTQDFSLGINLAYRYYWGLEGLGQVGYGLLLKHAFGSSRGWAWRPYLQYGLLLQLTSRVGHTSTPAAHDTFLSAGVETDRFFVQAGFHLSHLGQWDAPTIGLSYGECVAGYRWNWAARTQSSLDK